MRWRDSLAVANHLSQLANLALAQMIGKTENVPLECSKKAVTT